VNIVVSCNCGQRFAAQLYLAGKQVSCPSCGQPLQVPSQSAYSGQSTLAVSCQCGQRFAAPPHLAGRQVNCPQCNRIISVPTVGSPPSPQPSTSAANAWSNTASNQANWNQNPPSPLANQSAMTGWNSWPKRRSGNSVLARMAFLSWVLPAAGTGLSVVINTVAEPMGVIGGVLFILGVLSGLGLSIVCIIVCRGQGQSRGHSIAGLVVSGVLVLLVIALLPAVHMAREAAKKAEEQDSQPIFESPKDTMQAHYEALTEFDWAMLVRTYTPESRRHLAAEQVLMLWKKDITEKEMSRRFSDKYDLDFSKSPFRAGPKLTTMDDVDLAYKAVDQLNDQVRFLAESQEIDMNLNMTYLQEPPNSTSKKKIRFPAPIVDSVKIAGDKATAEVRYDIGGGFLSQTEEFQKVDGSWLLVRRSSEFKKLLERLKTGS
jgi:hypothetical protein